jgi:MFS family permease
MAERSQFSVLRHAGVRRLFWATLSSNLGTWLATVALAVDVYDRTHHSSLWVGALLVADVLPIALFSFLLGPLIDRLPRRRLMIGGDLFRAALFICLIAAPSAWVIVALAGLVGVASGLFMPTVYSGLPNLVDESELTSANALFQLVGSATMIAGPLAGGVIVATLGPHPAYLLNAASFGVSALFLLGISSASLQSETTPSPGYLHDLLIGAATVFRSRPLLTVFCAWNAAMVAIAASNTTELALARDDFHAGNFGYGLFMASSGSGIFLGALIARAVLSWRPFAAAYTLGFALIGAAFVAVSLVPPLALACIFLVVGGVGNGVLLTANPTLVQQGAPDELRGRAFTLIMSSNALFLTIASPVSGWLADHTSAHFVWTLAGADTALAGIIAWLLARPLALPGSPSETAPGVEIAPESSSL